MRFGKLQWVKTWSKWKLTGEDSAKPSGKSRSNFCRKTQTPLAMHTPKYDQLLMYFEHEVVTVALNKDFLRSPETAEKHVNEIVRQGGLEPNFVEPNFL